MEHDESSRTARQMAAEVNASHIPWTATFKGHDLAAHAIESGYRIETLKEQARALGLEVDGSDITLGKAIAAATGDDPEARARMERLVYGKVLTESEREHVRRLAEGRHPGVPVPYGDECTRWLTEGIAWPSGVRYVHDAGAKAGLPRLPGENRGAYIKRLHEAGVLFMRSSDDGHALEPASLALVRREVQEAMRAYPRLRRWVDDVEVLGGAAPVVVVRAGDLPEYTHRRETMEQVRRDAQGVAALWDRDVADREANPPPECPVCLVALGGVCERCAAERAGATVRYDIEQKPEGWEAGKAAGPQKPEGWTFEVDSEGDVRAIREGTSLEHDRCYFCLAGCGAAVAYNDNARYWSMHDEPARQYAAHLIGQTAPPIDPETAEPGDPRVEREEPTKPWTPKVGDRVRLLAWEGKLAGLTFFDGRMTEAVGRVETVVDVLDDAVLVVGWCWPVAALELVEFAARSDMA